MLRSKSRSGTFDFGQKHHLSVLSRTISASKLCRGDPLVSQIDRQAFISIDQKNLSQNRIDRVSRMQQQKGEPGEELRTTKGQLDEATEERDRAIDELREMKQVAHEANMKLSEALLSNSKGELATKEKNIESLKDELEKAKQSQLKLAEMESSLDRLKEELSKSKVFETHATSLLSESAKKILELEAEVERGKLSELKMFESVLSQTKQLEETKIELEESKLEIASLREQMENLQISSGKSTNGSQNNEQNDSMKEAFDSLKSELQLAKENLARAQDGEMVASSKAKRLFDEMGLVKNELKLATDAEETSKKAMDELALALKEVATEANQAKEKISSTQLELEHVQGEAEQLKELVKSTEDTYKKLLDEAKKEKEVHQNTADRLRLEAEDSVLAWNGKEMVFVDCIKRADEEKSIAQDENTRLTESLKVAENSTRTAREESYKLRDILKQALNEANAAKAAASIARDENSQLKDCLAEKDGALHFLIQENERLRIDGAAANENVKEFKKLLSTSSTELKSEDKEKGRIFKPPNSVVELQHEKKSKKTFSFDLNELFFNKRDDVEEKVVDADPEKAEALKGSIFDTVDSPKLEPPKAKSWFHYRRGSTSAITDDAETPNAEDFDNLDGLHFDDADSDRHSHRRRKSAILLRRFGDLIMKKSSHNHKKEPSPTE